MKKPNLAMILIIVFIASPFLLALLNVLNNAPAAVMSHSGQKKLMEKGTDQRSQTEYPEPTSQNIPEYPESGAYTFILLGSDASEYRADMLPQTDAIVLLHIKSDDISARITLIQVPRELFDEELNLKANQMYSHGGFDLIESYIEKTFGTMVHGTAVLDMDAFPSLIDDLGGLDIEIDDHIYDKCGGKVYEYLPGVYHMDGEETTCFARMRMLSPGGYFDRSDRHALILSALGTALRDKIVNDPMISAQLMGSIKGYVNTNIAPPLMISLITDLLPLHSQENIAVKFVTIKPDILKLYPRPTEKYPYLYRATVDLKEWFKENVK